MSDPFATLAPSPHDAQPIPEAEPQHIGRYRIERVLGQGGFGLVYLAWDEQLTRPVAIKVPHRQLIASADDAGAYLTEARTVANLDHPNIVPVHDVGSTEQFPCYVVSKYIDGTDLANMLKKSRLPIHEIVALLTNVAEALHHAHLQGLVHRDIKPGNLLLDKIGKPYVADFGMALREENVGKGPRYAGTPAYMSPEQARGEGHRVDGRSDIFSLGVVFYELLTGRRPFRADAHDELLEQITRAEARPPRQIDDTIPKELERICLRAMSKRAVDRYSTAKDLADDLRHFLAGASAEEKSALTGQARSETDVATPVPTPLPTPVSAQPVKIVPKGLRSFDAADADFFLDLLPGPRDRDGLPESIRFWKTRIEETDLDKTFAVGLICGPSGCGKSSLVKAGLLPRLAGNVIAVYVEATAEETEARLLNGLRKKCPSLPTNLGLIETLAALRREHRVTKVLIVLDQFEQWLHAQRAASVSDRNHSPLVHALRQCDGSRVQCIVMVRDDFWMAVIRFMRDLEIRLLDGHNSAAVDLFEMDHARKVLASFGQAFGVLPQAERAGPPIDPALQALLGRLDQLSGPFHDLGEGVHKAIQVADVDPEMALTRTRKVLEFVIRDVYEWRIKEPAGTRPLENLLQRIVKDGHFPDRLDAYANTIRKLGNVGTHSFGAQITASDVYQSLTQLMLILEWYMELERPQPPAQDPSAKKTVPAKAVLDPSSAAGTEQQEFLNQAIAGLAQEGKVICVRLALFATLMKGKPWTPASLKAVGGTEGIGVTFLEETFSATNAPPEHRYHQKAARRVLKSLLPESGTDIKGHMRSYAELLEASGYASNSRDFADLLGILDSEVRLITPTDPEGKEDVGEPGNVSPRSPDARYYQLTHDYLVPSLREWLTRKQKETRRGRAELLLADRAAIWNARLENRQLPSLLQWLQIRWWTRKKNWTPPQRKMMRKARRYHGVRGLVLAVLLVAGALLGLEIRSRVIEQDKVTQAAGLVETLLNAKIGQVPEIISKIEAYRTWADPLLREENAKAALDSPQKLHASLALLRGGDASQLDYLYERLLDAEPNEVPILVAALAPHKEALRDKLWQIAEQPAAKKEKQRLRAAAALASYDSQSERWAKVQDQVANDLVTVPAVYLEAWMNSLRLARGKLQTPLAVIFRDAKRRETERSLATDILADYAAGQSDLLADLLMDADEKQFAALYPKLKDHGERGMVLLQGEVDKPLQHAAIDDKEKLAKRQANAAVALLKMNQPAKVWPLLKHSSDPRARSYLIHRFGPLGADARDIVKRLEEEPDVTIQRALILSLGEFTKDGLTAEERKAVTKKLQDIYCTAADPGLHGAAEWLLRSWEQEPWLKQINEDWQNDNAQQEKQQKASRAALVPGASPQWYVSSQGHTMVVIPESAEPFLMGSPLTEVGWDDREVQHKKRIGRTFAIAAKSVTMGQILAMQKNYFGKEEGLVRRYAPKDECPALAINWHDAAEYCNWLSKKEGLDECYQIKNGQVTQLKENYLSLTGYRLPTEAEMEYATRAGALTSRYYGETEDLLPKYAWYLKNSQEKTWPVGSLKPNDLGLFDVQGNVFTWCQESYKPYPSAIGGETIEDKEDAVLVIGTGSRVLRGGSFLVQASIVRSALRNYVVPTNRYTTYGFRVARTLLLDSFTALQPSPEGGEK